MICIILGLIALFAMLFFQVWNFVHYKDTNGYQRTRIFFLISTIALVVHEIRLSYGITTGFFLLIHIIFLVFLFDSGRITAFIKWVKSKVYGKRNPN
jgi:O-antigen ligase